MKPFWPESGVCGSCWLHCGFPATMGQNSRPALGGGHVKVKAEPLGSPGRVGDQAMKSEAAAQPDGGKARKGTAVRKTGALGPSPGRHKPGSRAGAWAKVKSNYRRQGFAAGVRCVLSMLDRYVATNDPEAPRIAALVGRCASCYNDVGECGCGLGAGSSRASWRGILLASLPASGEGASGAESFGWFRGFTSGGAASHFQVLH